MVNYLFEVGDTVLLAKNARTGNDIQYKLQNMKGKTYEILNRYEWRHNNYYRISGDYTVDILEKYLQLVNVPVCLTEQEVSDILGCK